MIICRRSDDGSIGNSMDGAVYRSRDGAESWTKMKLPEGTNGPMSLVIDPENNNRLLISAWGRATPGQFSPDTGGGIFLSDDNGATWNQVLEKDQHIHDITMIPEITLSMPAVLTDRHTAQMTGVKPGPGSKVIISSGVSGLILILQIPERYMS